MTSIRNGRTGLSFSHWLQQVSTYTTGNCLAQINDYYPNIEVKRKKTNKLVITTQVVWKKETSETHHAMFTKNTWMISFHFMNLKQTKQLHHAGRRRCVITDDGNFILLFNRCSNKLIAEKTNIVQNIARKAGILISDVTTSNRNWHNFDRERPM